MIVQNTTEGLRNLITKMRSDKVFTSKFDGSIKNGRIEGFYTNIARSQTGISFLKVTGTYDLTTGVLNLNLKPSNVFFVAFSIAIAFIAVSLYGFITNDIELIPRIGALALGFILGLGYTIGFLLERKKFMKHIDSLNEFSL